MRQVGHLPELYEDARSEKCKIFNDRLRKVHFKWKNLGGIYCIGQQCLLIAEKEVQVT